MRRVRLAILAHPGGAAMGVALGWAFLAAPALAQDGTAQAAPADDTGRDIVVTGTRAATRKANAEKRKADNAVETLQANDIGKLPDQNVAEAVKRLPGLSVANDQGEGRYVIIRGINPALTNVALNNQTLPAPEPSSRQVKLDDLPSGLIQSITVTKALLPSQDANAVGGEVNINTKTAFDSKKPFFLDAQGSFGTYLLNNKNPWDAAATVGGRFGASQRFGAVVAINYSKRPIESENFQGSTNWTTPAGGSGFAPDAGGLRDYNLTRKRLGLVGNFDWHPSDEVKVYLRSSYSEFSDNETRDQNLLDAITNTSATASTGTFKARGSVLVRRRREDDNTKSVTVGGDFKLPLGELSVSGGWTRAVKIDPIRSEFRFRTGSNAITGTYNLGPSPYIYTPTIGSNLSAYIFNSFNLETRQAAEDIWQGRADYKVPIALGEDSSIKVGFKYLDRHKTNNQDRTNYTTTTGTTGSASFQLPSVDYFADTNFYGSTYTFGPRIDYAAAHAYLSANPAASKIDTAGSISATLANDYDVSETIVAGYVMATLKFGALTLTPGVRVEHTRDSNKAKIVRTTSTLTDGFNSFGGTSYTDAFPGLNAKYEISSDLILRGAVTTSLGRPDYPTLAPTVSVVDATPQTLITLGNPALKPYYATNLDGSIEYYPNQDSLFSVGVFYKHLDNPIYVTQFTSTNGSYGGTTYANALVTQSFNADYQILSGVEANASTQFTFLPGILSGLGISANYAHISGHSIALTFRAGRLPLLLQSGDVGNVQLFFEKYGLAARVAFNYRSAYLDTIGSTGATDQYTDANGQLDVHVSYQILPQVTIFGDATNLTDAPWRRYIGNRSFLVERERYDAMVRGGVQVHF